MSKIKIISAIAGIVVLAGAGAGYVFLQKAAAPVSSVSETAEVAGVQSATDTSAVSQAVPLNQTAPTPAAAAGLQVGSNSGATQGGNSQLAVGGSPQASSAAGNTNPFDPKTFATYEKHKNETTALYADALVGEGVTLEANKKAAVYYRGWLTNGAVFDESKAGADGKMTPFIFTLGARQVIPGWEQALAGMKVGGVRLVIVPPAAGYGAMQQNGIPPNSVLVFQVQLAEVQ